MGIATTIKNMWKEIREIKAQTYAILKKEIGDRLNDKDVVIDFWHHFDDETDLHFDNQNTASGEFEIHAYPILRDHLSRNFTDTSVGITII